MVLVKFSKWKNLGSSFGSFRWNSDSNPPKGFEVHWSGDFIDSIVNSIMDTIHWIASRITRCIASGWPNGQKDDPIDNLEDKCGKFKRVNRNQVKSKLFKRLTLCTLGALIWSRLGCTGHWVSTAIGLQFIGMIAMQSISNQRDQWNLFEWYLLMGSDWWPILTADSLDSILWIPKRSFNEMWTSRRTRCTHLGCKFLWNSFGIGKSIVGPTITAYGHDSLTIFWAKFVPAGHRRSCSEILGKHSWVASFWFLRRVLFKSRPCLNSLCEPPNTFQIPWNQSFGFSIFEPAKG